LKLYLSWHSQKCEKLNIYFFNIKIFLLSCQIRRINYNSLFLYFSFPLMYSFQVIILSISWRRFSLSLSLFLCLSFSLSLSFSSVLIKNSLPICTSVARRKRNYHWAFVRVFPRLFAFVTAASRTCISTFFPVAFASMRMRSLALNSEISLLHFLSSTITIPSLETIA